MDVFDIVGVGLHVRACVFSLSCYAFSVCGVNRFLLRLRRKETVAEHTNPQTIRIRLAQSSRWLDVDHGVIAGMVESSKEDMLRFRLQPIFAQEPVLVRPLDLLGRSVA